MNKLIIISFIILQVCYCEILNVNINVCVDAERVDFENSCSTHDIDCIEDINYLKSYRKNNSAFAPIFCPAVKFLFLVKIFQFLHIFIDLFITFSTVFFIFYVITVKKLYSKKSIEFWPFLVIFYIKN